MSALTGRWDDKYDVCVCGWYRHYHGRFLNECVDFRLAKSAYNPSENPPRPEGAHDERG